MKEQTIKDFYGKILGYIRTEPNGDKTAFDFYRRKLGTWDKQKDITKDWLGRIVSSGDSLAVLISNGDKK